MLRRFRSRTLAQRINQAHEGAIRSARTAIEYAIECGRLLTEAKALVGHGNWLPWLQANTIVSERTAQRWMRFAENAETLLAKSDTDGGITFAEADRLLAAPKPAPAASQSEEPEDVMARGKELGDRCRDFSAFGPAIDQWLDSLSEFAARDYAEEMAVADGVQRNDAKVMIRKLRRNLRNRNLLRDEILVEIQKQMLGR